jgi:hypothetical protein
MPQWQMTKYVSNWQLCLVNERLVNERLVNERLVNERLVNERLVNERSMDRNILRQFFDSACKKMVVAL